MQTAHDTWLEAPCQAAEDYALHIERERDSRLSDSEWLASAIADSEARWKIGELLGSLSNWSDDSTARVIGRLVMTDLYAMADREARS